MTSSKAEFRHIGLKARDSVDSERRMRCARHIAQVGMQLVRAFSADMDRAAVVSLYAPIGSEPDVTPLAAALQEAGYPMALPVDWSSGTALLYRLWTPGDRLAAGPLGIGEPLENAPELEPDVLFVPMAVFDRRGHRVGYGVGNVDRTLRSLRARKSVRVIGLAFAEQEIALVPNDPHDEPLDIVLTDREIVTCRA